MILKICIRMFEHEIYEVFRGNLHAINSSSEKQRLD